MNNTTPTIIPTLNFHKGRNSSNNLKLVEDDILILNILEILYEKKCISFEISMLCAQRKILLKGGVRQVEHFLFQEPIPRKLVKIIDSTSNQQQQKSWQITEEGKIASEDKKIPPKPPIWVNHTDFINHV